MDLKTGEEASPANTNFTKSPSASVRVPRHNYGPTVRFNYEITKPLITEPSKTAHVYVAVRFSNTNTRHCPIFFIIFTYIPHADWATHTYILRSNNPFNLFLLLSLIRFPSTLISPTYVASLFLPNTSRPSLSVLSRLPLKTSVHINKDFFVNSHE